MKTYIKPELEMKLFETEDVITTSAIIYGLLKTSVNGNEGDDYGSRNVYSFDE